MVLPSKRATSARPDGFGGNDCVMVYSARDFEGSVLMLEAMSGHWMSFIATLCGSLTPCPASWIVRALVSHSRKSACIWTLDLRLLSCMNGDPEMRGMNAWT